MVIDTWGQLYSTNASSQQATIIDQGDHVLVWMDSREAAFGEGGTG